MIAVICAMLGGAIILTVVAVAVLGWAGLVPTGQRVGLYILAPAPGIKPRIHLPHMAVALTLSYTGIKVLSCFTMNKTCIFDQKMTSYDRVATQPPKPLG